MRLRYRPDLYLRDLYFGISGMKSRAFYSRSLLLSGRREKGRPWFTSASLGRLPSHLPTQKIAGIRSSGQSQRPRDQLREWLASFD